MADDASERSEKATPHKREEARKKGQIARSPDVSAVVLLAAGLMVLNWYGSTMMSDLVTVFTELIRHAGDIPLTPEEMPGYLLGGAWFLGVMLAPFFLALTVIGVGINLAQVGFLFSWETMKPSYEKFDPIKGFTRMFSQETLASLIREPLKVGVIGLIGYVLIRSIYQEILLSSDRDIGALMLFIGEKIMWFAFGITAALMAVAGIDYAYRWWKHERDLRMSKQDIKEENKQSEGNPEVRAKIRSIQQGMKRKRMLDTVPAADVVITNPTHLAVALQYTPGEAAPRVVAKGARLMALRIREIAEANGVPIVENKPVARTLYQMVEVDQEIPADMYQAVAEILAFVYRLKRKTAFR